jgi:hypothetical protein
VKREGHRLSERRRGQNRCEYRRRQNTLHIELV